MICSSLNLDRFFVRLLSVAVSQREVRRYPIRGSHCLRGSYNVLTICLIRCAAGAVFNPGLAVAVRGSNRR
jgi:hypothetical protein